MNAGTYKYQLVGGNLALDFVNTVAYRFHPEKIEDHLRSGEELGQWASQGGLADAVRLCSRLSGPGLRRVRNVRDQLFTIFHAMASAKQLPAELLRAVGEELRRCQAKQCLSAQGGEVRWAWRSGAGCEDILLCSVLTAAADLLTSGSRNLIRQCADEGCGWLFLDRSNAGKRRWCSMADCGNRNKVREHYRRAGHRP